MDKRTHSEDTQTPRVVRTGPKTPRKKYRKPTTKGMRMFKTIAASVGKVFLTGMLVLTITCCIVGTALTIYVMQYIDSDSQINLNDLKMNYTTVFYGIDKDGNPAEMQRLHKEENRIWVDYSNIPQSVKDAFVCVEDKRFYQHDGVDFKRTFGAVLDLMKRMLTGSDDPAFGGSTITQQLIKNINGDIYDRSYGNKIKEIMQAMNMERNYSKDQILEAYLNYIGLGHNTNGVQAAAKYYFNKDVSDLNINEAASLAGITKNPSKNNPLDGPEKNSQRRKYALDQMLENGKITKEEHDKYYDVPVTVNKGNSGAQTGDSGVYSYFTDAVIEQVVDDLEAEYGYTYEEAEQKLLTGGWKVYTTMDIVVQSRLENMFVNSATFAYRNVKDSVIPQASMVICDYDGNVRALVGGRGEKTVARGFNRATQAVRGFGSTIKPLSIYAPAMEQNLINWSTIMTDKAVMQVKDEKTGNMRSYHKNYNGKYEGAMPIIEALKVSKNTIPVELCNNMTPEYCYDFLTKNFHFPNLVTNAEQIGPDTMALGSAGTTLMDVTAAFQIFGNGGYYTEPKLYSKVVDADGKTLLDVSSRKKNQVLSSETAFIMNRALWRVVNEKPGSGTGAKLSKWETIGKTGTSMDRKDLLFMGCTPYYVAGIRYGNDDNSNIADSVSNSQIGVWKKVMEEVLKDRNTAKFELDATGVTEQTYCRATGLLATSGCPSKGTGYYKKDHLPGTCTLHGGGGGVDSGASSSENGTANDTETSVE